MPFCQWNCLNGMLKYIDSGNDFCATFPQPIGSDSFARTAWIYWYCYAFLFAKYLIDVRFYCCLCAAQHQHLSIAFSWMWASIMFRSHKFVSFNFLFKLNVTKCRAQNVIEVLLFTFYFISDLYILFKYACQRLFANAQSQLLLLLMKYGAEERPTVSTRENGTKHKMKIEKRMPNYENVYVNFHREYRKHTMGKDFTSILRLNCYL